MMGKFGEEGVKRGWKCNEVLDGNGPLQYAHMRSVGLSSVGRVEKKGRIHWQPAPLKLDLTSSVVKILGARCTHVPT